MKLPLSLLLSILLTFHFVQSYSQIQLLQIDESDLQSQLNDLHDALPDGSDLQNEVNQLLEDLEATKEQAAQDLENLDNDYQANVTALSQQYDPQLNQLQSELAVLDSQIQQIDVDVAALKEQKKSTKDNNKKKEIQQSIDTKNSEKTQLKDQRKQTNQKLTKLQNEYNKKKEQLNKQYENSKNSISTKEENKLTNLNNQYQQLKAEVDQFLANQNTDQTTPDETTPDETTPDETTPDETTPDETTPDETTPDESTPDETTPDQTTDQNCNAKPIYYREAVTNIIGSTFNKKGYSQWTYDNFQFVEAITIYFTASWCGSCKSFTPQLEQFYNQVNSGGCFKYENVASLYEYSQGAYDSYSLGMSFARQPYGQNSVYSRYGVSGIPTLILINKDGTEANRNARSDVTYKGTNCFNEWVQNVAAYSNPQYEQTTTQQQSNGKPSNVDDVSWTAFLESNKFRNSQGKDNQEWDNLLYELCVGHNSYQISAGTISHDGFSERCNSIPNWQSCAENVAYNYDTTNPGAKAVDQWINSDGHRKNILSDNHYMAVSGVKDDPTGRWYFCQFFANK